MKLVRNVFFVLCILTSMGWSCFVVDLAHEGQSLENILFALFIAVVSLGLAIFILLAPKHLEPKQ